MRRLLKIHSRSQCPAVAQIEVEITRPRAYGLILNYIITGKICELFISPVGGSERHDDLWRHTCFEAFIRDSGTAYCEFNFAPTTEWAAYRFSDYRSGRRAPDIAAPVIEVRVTADRYALQAALQLESLSDLLSQAAWHLGLSALVEDKSGSISYWALTHPFGKPDFHNSVSFACELPPMVQA